jgi:hypothetical protein
MHPEKIKPIVKGLIKHIPGAHEFLHKKTGGSIQSRYCYTVWMRHLANWSLFKDGIPEVVAELGPGDSLGTGLAALLSGCKHLYALDVVKYWNNDRNIKMFDELIELFKKKAYLPDNTEYPQVIPSLDNYNFPSHILPDKLLKETLAEDRLNAIRNELATIDNPNNTYIKYKIPWNDSNVINTNSVDFLYSQAVLEHVEDLETTYSAMQKWIKPSGLISHSIDFRSHGLTKSWNGHWTFNNFEWRIVKAGKIFLLNRQPLSKHVELTLKNGFKILKKSVVKMENKLKPNRFSNEFKKMSEEDVTSSVAYILSIKE